MQNGSHIVHSCVLDFFALWFGLTIVNLLVVPYGGHSTQRGGSLGRGVASPSPQVGGRGVLGRGTDVITKKCSRTSLCPAAAHTHAHTRGRLTCCLARASCRTHTKSLDDIKRRAVSHTRLQPLQTLSGFARGYGCAFSGGLSIGRERRGGERRGGERRGERRGRERRGECRRGWQRRGSIVIRVIRHPSSRLR